MISTENVARNYSASDADFTLDQYRELLRLSKVGWEFVRYSAIPWGSRFILWRHDVDYSLNRSLALARIEEEEGVVATYFVNPHSEFYNLAELGQCKIIEEILLLGHDLGLHFDAAFYDVDDEEKLTDLVRREARNLKEMFGISPVAFSFHNPVSSHFDCEADQYGGVLNCYSQRFKEQVGYCSDSNGYWRFRRLREVLTEASDARLQVLTHPGWWQDVAQSPRQRVFRSVYGRAAATMQLYDSGLQQHGRLNHAGEAGSLLFLAIVQPKLYKICDYLWNQEYFESLFIELWRLHEAQLYRLCDVYLQRGWNIPEHEVSSFFDAYGGTIDKRKLFNVVFDEEWSGVVCVDESEYLKWVDIQNQLYHRSSSLDNVDLKAGCVYLCRMIDKTSVWGQKHKVGYDGLTELVISSLLSSEMVKLSSDLVEPINLNAQSGYRARWESLLAIFAVSS